MARRTAFVLSVCLAAGSAVGAEPIDILTHTPARVHEGQTVVRVTADSAREVAAALALAEGLWSERAGVGPFDIQVRTDRVPVLIQAGLEVETRIADLQAHADLAWSRVQAAERMLRARPPLPPRPAGAARGASPHDETWFENYKQLAQIEAYVAGLHGARPDLTSLAVVGQSLQDRPIRAITITGPDEPGNAAADRPVILWNGCQHAREWISPMTVTYIASRLVSDYDTDPAVRSLVDSTRIVIVPVSNPDGYLYSWSSQRYWRKNRRPNNAIDYGVDLNRNWGYQWGGAGSSPSPSSDIYRGTAAFSEPETRVLRDLALSYGGRLAAHIDYHSFSQLILYPFGYANGVMAPEPDNSFFASLTTDMANLIFDLSGVAYRPIPSWQLYAAAGGATDWFYGAAGAKSLTIELRPGENVTSLEGFDPPPSTILPTARENFAAAMLFADRTTQPLSFSVHAPGTVRADEPTGITFVVAPGTAGLDSASVRAFAAVGAGDAVELGVSPAGPGTYAATLPPVPCGQSVAFSFRATTTGGAVIDYPPPPAGPFIASAVRVLLEDGMETDTGWVVGAPGDNAASGIWTRMAPQATAAQPGADHSPDGTLCWITDGRAGSGVGSYDIDGGTTTLTSPRLDASDAGPDAELVYWRWYSNDQGASPNSDDMPVLISNDDGATWTTLEVVTENANAWVEKRFRIADFVGPTADIRVRFVARDLDPGSVVEAGVDDLSIVTPNCPAPAQTADLAEPFGVFNFFDVAAYLALYNAGDPGADYTGDGELNFFDLSAYLTLFNAGI